MLENNQILENEEKVEPTVKKNPVVEIDLKKGEKRKLTLLGFRGKVVLSIFLMIYFTIGIGVATIVALSYGEEYIALVLAGIMILASILYPIKLTKAIRNHKRRYLLKSDNLSDLVDFLECPNYEEKVRVEDKKITFEVDEEEIDYYDDYDDFEEEEDESTTFVHAFTEIDFSEMALDIVDFAKKKGLLTDIASVRSFMSAINSSHLVEINSRNLEISKKFVDVVSEYLSRKPFYAKENQSWESTEDILWKKHNNTVIESEIQKSVINASKNKNHFTFLGLVDVHYHKLEEYFSQFLTFINYPNRRLLLEVSDKFSNGVDPVGKVSIPKNLWFIVFPKQNIENKASLKTIKNLVSIEITGSLTEAESPDLTKESVLIDQFEYSVHKAADNYDISEELWKKYDEFMKKVEEIVELDINDKYFYGIENFATMYASTGADEAVAVDNVINSKIIPMIINNKDLELDEIKVLISAVENIFDTEGFTVTLKTLNKLKGN